jgi:hypothetical protein
MFRGIQLFREVTAGGGGGTASGINPSLAQLESGDGLPIIPSLTEEAEKAAAAAKASQANPNGDGTPDPGKGPVGTGTPAGDPATPAGQPGAAPADSPKPGETPDKKPGGEGTGAPAGEGGTGEDGEGAEGDGDGEEYYSVVDKITGRQYEIKYPEGIDPVTPEGTAFREDYIREATYQEFEQHLKESVPRGFAYMLHLQNGGTDEEFFNDPAKGFVLPSLDTMTSSVDVQKSVFTQDLVNKGIDKETVDAIVEKAIKDNKLLEKATASYNFITNSQKLYLEEQQRQMNDNHARTTAAVQDITARFNQATESMSFIIPDNKKAEFNKFIVDNLQMTDEGKFMLVQEVDPKDLKGITESLFFQFAKGDLNQYVQKKVKTEATQRLRLNVEKTKTSTTRDAGVDNTAGKKLTLGEL